MLIAVSGLICSGKSEVINTLKELGANIIKTDDINRELLTMANYIAQLKKIFPSCINSDNTVNKAQLRDIIFNDKVAREQLNALAHPIIVAEVLKRAKSMGGVVFVENPLIITSKSQHMFDKIWVVTALDEIRAARLVQRDNVRLEDAIKTLNSQSEEKKAIKIADIIIENNYSKKDLEETVVELFNKYAR